MHHTIHFHNIAAAHKFARDAKLHRSEYVARTRTSITVNSTCEKGASLLQLARNSATVYQIN